MLLTVCDVAQKLKVSSQHIRSVLRKGELEAEMVGKQWIVREDSLRQYLENYCISIEPDDHPRKSDDVPDIVALSFFSGAMGLDIGMKAAGIDTLLACEIDKHCRITINKNAPEKALLGDITKLSAKEILEFARIPKGRKIDIIFGGPPCQAFSTAGKRKGFDDSRGNVFLKFIDLIADILPTYVVIENVRGLLSAPYPCMNACQAGDEAQPVKGGALLHVIQKLRNAGYSVSFELYNAANFGAPQTRERVVVVAHRGKTKIPYLTPTHSDNPKYGLPGWRTLANALESLPDDTEHHYVSFPEERLKYYRMLEEGQHWKHLPDEVQKEAMGKSYYLGGGKTGFYRRLSFSKPSPTLVTHPAMPATDLGHPIEDRPLSVEEYACIQGFPLDWEISGSVVEKYKQIGNAVPIRLGEAIGRLLMLHIQGKKIPRYPEFQYSRYKNTDDAAWENIVRLQMLKDAERLRVTT
ncbi:MAG: DNA cytosine methyltransferase [Coriobacteriales bacterium]|jgi:DNA (cytosine-5)-methyltransferase 1|nr:DNA cytosine methyltransferase [Coriobacteriales bacterium]